MTWIEFKIRYSEGKEKIVGVYARSIASGLRKVARNCETNVPGDWGHVHSIEFWQAPKGVKR